jgi:signal peptidase I
MFLTGSQAQSVKGLSFIRSFEEDRNDYSSPGEPLFPLKYSEGWTGDNYGPLWIPKKDAAISVNDSTLSIYGELIKDYEGNKNVVMGDGKLTIDGEDVSTYTFTQDYYFMMGDNRHNSLDSRYWGFVPKDHIVGKPLFVWFSMDEHASLLSAIRWSRIGTLIR